MRMKARAANQFRISVDSRNVKKPKDRRVSDVLSKLECSPKMKKFIMSEISKEKAKYTHLPSTQVASKVLHRYHEMRMNLRIVPKEEGNTVSRPADVRLSGRKRNMASVETDDSGSDDIDISEFDEEKLPIPSPGAFALSPSPSQLKANKRLLLFLSDQDTALISDSSPEPSQIVSPKVTPKKKSYFGDEVFRKVKLSPEDPRIPHLSSPSLADGVEMFGREPAEADSASSSSEDTILAHNLLSGVACGSCMETRSGEQLSLCSGCHTVSYCGTKCQNRNWSRHKKVCKIMKDAKVEEKLSFFYKEIQWLNELKAKQSTKKRSKKAVTINSQPEYAPSNEEEEVKQVATPKKVRSILKKGKGQLAVEVVMKSPTISNVHYNEASANTKASPSVNGKLNVSSATTSSPSPPVKRNLLSKFSPSSGSNVSEGKFPGTEDKSNVDLEEKSPKKLPLTPVKSNEHDATATPLNSPRLLQSILTNSESRTSSRIHQEKRRRDTPHPTKALLDPVLKSSMSTNPRKIDFEKVSEDQVDDQILDTEEKVLTSAKTEPSPPPGSPESTPHQSSKSPESSSRSESWETSPKSSGSPRASSPTAQSESATVVKAPGSHGSTGNPGDLLGDFSESSGNLSVLSDFAAIQVNYLVQV